MLRERISNRVSVRVGVIGLGYVGLPLAVRLAEIGFSVIGIDVSQEIISALISGKSTLEIIEDSLIKSTLECKRFRPLLVSREISETNQSALDSLVGIEVFIVCVQTPLHSGRAWEPDTIWIRRAAELIEEVHQAEIKLNQMPKERLLVLESTTYPGTTREIFAPVVRKFRDRGISTYLAYSPERSNPGPKLDSHVSEVGRDPFKVPRVVGGFDDASNDMALALYGSVFSSVYNAESLEAAEMVKLVENTFRFVSIGFANEMARIARVFGLDIWEIIRGAKSKGFGLDLCFPGLIGGHCIPIDPHYLNWAVRTRRQLATFVDVAEKAHHDIREDAVDLIQRILYERGKGLPGSSILLLGVAYKENISDTRESGAFDVMKRIFTLGADICFWDPVRHERCSGRSVKLGFTEEDCRLLSPDGLRRLSAAKDDGDAKRYLEPEELIGTWTELRSVCLSRFDCVVIATGHDVFHTMYRELIMAEDGPPIVDLRDAIRLWMREKASATERGVLEERLKNRSKYMLLGVH